MDTRKPKTHGPRALSRPKGMSPCLRRGPTVCLTLAALIGPPATTAQPAGLSASSDVPGYTVRRTTGPLRIDGRLDEADWRRAERVGAFRTWDNKPAADDTDVKVLWDNGRVYFAFHCRDTHIVARPSRRDDPLWEADDVVEFFVDPEGTLKMYVEVIVSARNVLFDAYQITNAAGDAPELMFKDWDGKGIQSAVRVEGRLKRPGEPADGRDRTWTAEVSVPYDTFIRIKNKPPKDCDEWRAALTRYNRPDASTPEWHTARSPPFRRGWPHMTARFGRLVFTSRPVGN
jgi:hypothetical protein